MIKTKGLGRGLDVLLSGNSKTDSNDALMELAVAKIQPGRYQPRTRMDAASLRELADSIKDRGMMQPILVRRLDSSKYEIIAGERRWRAAEMAGLARVPALVRDVPDEAAAAMALIENIQRENLNPLEEAYGIQRLVDDFKMTHELAAQAVGRSRSAVTNLLRLTQLAKPVQELLMDGALDMGHARALLSLSPARQVEVANQVVAKGLNVRDTERLASEQNQARKSTARRTTPDPDVRRLEQEWCETLGTTVTFKVRQKGGGTIAIEYASLDQLDEILKRLRGD
jgi:ParB family transcriptional regulator, chromosome partitioning protein